MGLGLGSRRVATMVVLQLPPSESSRSRVSFESRYGTCSGGGRRVGVQACTGAWAQACRRAGVQACRRAGVKG